jgi:type IV secretory pathway TrbL component
MNTKSMKQTLGLAAAAVGTSGAMMLAPAAANAATAHPAHTQTVSTVSTVSNFAKAGNGSRHCRTVRYRTILRTVHGPRTVYRNRTVCR